MLSLRSILAVAFFWAIGISASPTPNVDVLNGTIHGRQCADRAAHAYLGIPYAQAPVGSLRFAPPQSHNTTFPSGELNATVPPPACIQFGDLFLEDPPWSEDCLFLDVWVPSKVEPDTPILFWIYGGGFNAGGISDDLYDGCYLASAANAIVVSANYRLGPLGFMYLPTAGVKGNMGVQDLLLALQWTKENIQSFGGDPTKVAIFGQSAGAILSFTLSTLPEAPMLMKAAIAESGAGQPVYSANESLANGIYFAQQLGCNSSDIQCFQSKSTNQLNASYQAGSPIGSSSQSKAMFPFVDGVTIPKNPLSVGSKVPFLAGTAGKDAALFELPQFPDPATLNAANYTSTIEQLFLNESSKVLAEYPYSDFENQPYPAFDGITKVLTDESFACPNKAALDATIMNGVPAFAYLWNHTETCPWLDQIKRPQLSILGPTHTSEIPFVFNHMVNLPAQPVTNGTCSLDHKEHIISKTIVAVWRNMAVSGCPGNQSSIRGGPWPHYDNTTSAGLVVNNITSIQRIDYSKCAFWAQLRSP